MKTKTCSVPLLLATLLAVLGMTSGCARVPAQPYADAYQAALQRYPGTADVTPAMTDRFVAFFNARADAGGPVSAEEVYADAVYFSDTLLTTEDRAAVLSHVDRMHESTDVMNVRVLGRLVDGADVYLVWRMRADFTAAGRDVSSDTVGISHLRFDDQGRIVLQQDFWDSAEGLYRHLPVMGGLINYVRGRFDDDSA